MKLFAVALLATVAIAAAQSHQIMPGAKIMGRGFDMVAGVQHSDTTSKVLLPVFDFSYDQGQTYTNPLNRSQIYSVPDQLVVTPTDQSVENINEGLESSYSEWISMKRSSFNVGVGVTIGQGTQAFSGNAKFSHESYVYKQEMKNETAASGFSRHYWSMFQLESYPPQFMPLNPMFKQITSELPTSIKTAADQAKYNQVVQYWGTHYTMLANFGGDVHVSTFVNKTFLASHSQSWVSNQFSLTFHYYLFQISAGGFLNHSDIHISKEFMEAAHTYIFYRGGNIGLQNNNTANEWVKTISEEPVYLNCTIAGLSTLIENPKIAATYRKVVLAYIKTGKLPTVHEDFDYESYYAGMDVPELVDPYIVSNNAYSQKLRAGKKHV